jgi:hypothetical protein
MANKRSVRMGSGCHRLWSRQTAVLSLLLLLFMVAGCASPRGPQIKAPAAQDMPAEAFMTHRAVLTARGKEFALTGYLAISRERGLRLIVSEMFGQQLADVLVKPDGSVHIMKASPMLKPQWLERYLAVDLKCLFGQADQLCPVTVLAPNHFLLKRRWYKLDLRLVETKPGPQKAELFDESKAISQ